MAEFAQKAFGWAATDTTGVLSPFHFSRRKNGADDVTIKILYCGVCHSDLHIAKNEWGFTKYPVVPGHEIVGVVTKTGNDVEKFKAGDRVGVGVIVGSCRTCDLCQEDLENYCPKTVFTYNATDKDGTRTYGGYSDIIVVNQHFVLRFPDNLPSDAGAPLLCAGITVYSPMKYYGMTEPGKHLGVAGLGGLGHVAVKFGKAFGLKVTVISTSPRKEDEAINKLRADAFLVSSDPAQLKVKGERKEGLYGMDPEEIRAILSRSRVGIWALIESAIKVASSDYGEELRRRRDKIVESLYAPEPLVCRTCNGSTNDAVIHHEPYYPENICNNYNNSENIENSKYADDDDDNKKFNDDNDSNRNLNEDVSKSPLTPESNHRNFSGGEEEEDVDPYGSLFDDEQTKILSIKEQLEDPHQSEDAVVELLQNLADMDITFQALKETDIGRHVNRLRKHESNEVRRFVKQLVRRWKDTVDEWVKVNQPQATSNLIADGDSPQQSIPKNQQNGHHQVPDFGYSPNPQNGRSSVERKYGEHETKPKPPQSAPRKEAPSRPPHSVPKSASAPPNRVQRESVVDDEKLNSARKRLQENYQEAQNAKKQRTIQVMDIHEIPKPRNGFIAKNKGGFQGRHHR